MLTIGNSALDYIAWKTKFFFLAPLYWSRYWSCAAGLFCYYVKCTRQLLGVFRKRALTTKCIKYAHALSTFKTHLKARVSNFKSFTCLYVRWWRMSPSIIYVKLLPKYFRVVLLVLTLEDKTSSLVTNSKCLKERQSFFFLLSQLISK